MNKWFAKRNRGRIWSAIFLVTISVTFLAESNMVPFPIIQNTQVPTFYSDLSKMKGTFAILDLPLNYDNSNRYMYYSTVSEKPIFGGSISRIPSNVAVFQEDFPLVEQMNYIEKGGIASNWQDIILQDVNQTNLKAFSYFNIKYIVLHRNMLSEDAFWQMKMYLIGLLGEPIFADETIMAFSTENNSVETSSPLIYFKDGWLSLENWSGTATRWTDGSGVLGIACPSSQRYDLSFLTATNVEYKNLRVLLNGKETGNFTVPTDKFQTLTLRNLDFKAGFNELSLISDKTFRPADVTKGSSDTRNFGIIVQNISLITK